MYSRKAGSGKSRVYTVYTITSDEVESVFHRSRLRTNNNITSKNTKTNNKMQ